MEGIDLRKFQEEGEDKQKIQSIMGKILSGREGYEAIVETRNDQLRCVNCNWLLEGGDKFCPECGTKQSND